MNKADSPITKREVTLLLTLFDKARDHLAIAAFFDAGGLPVLAAAADYLRLYRERGDLP